MVVYQWSSVGQKETTNINELNKMRQRTIFTVLQIHKNKKWPKFFFMLFEDTDFSYKLYIKIIQFINTQFFIPKKKVKNCCWKNSFAVVIWFIPSLCKFYHNFYHGNQSETGVIHRKHGSCIFIFFYVGFKVE